MTVGALLGVLVLAALVAVGLVVPFVVGLLRGPKQVRPGSGATDQSMRPLGRVADLYVGFFVFAIIFSAWRLKDGFYGNGPNGQACVDTGITGSPVEVAREWRTRPGTSLGGSGDLQACVAHPTAGQWALYALTAVPGVLLWVSVLLMILRLVRRAAQHGPFTPQAAVLMVRLGWLILAGCVVAGDLRALGASVLTNTVITPGPFGTGAVVANAVLDGPLKALLPVPALAGVALLSFGRVTGAGAVMDEELRATV
jgi:hypothetical protein